MRAAKVQQGEQARAFDIDPGIRDPFLPNRMLKDLLSERFSTHETLTHLLEGPLGNANHPHAVMDPSGPQAPLGNLEPPSLSEKDIARRDANIFEQNLPVAVGGIVETKDRKMPDDSHSRCIARHENHALLLMDGIIGIRPTHHD